MSVPTLGGGGGGVVGGGEGRSSRAVDCPLLAGKGICWESDFTSPVRMQEIMKVGGREFSN